MENLDRVVAAYIAMDQRHKTQNLAIMEEQAKKYMEKRKPLLRIVPRCLSPLPCDGGSILGSQDNIGPSNIIRSAK